MMSDFNIIGTSTVSRHQLYSRMCYNYLDRKSIQMSDLFHVQRQSIKDYRGLSSNVTLCEHIYVNDKSMRFQSFLHIRKQKTISFRLLFRRNCDSKNSNVCLVETESSSLMRDATREIARAMMLLMNANNCVLPLLLLLSISWNSSDITDSDERRKNRKQREIL